MVDEFPSHVVPERYKGQLITDDQIVAELESLILVPLDIDRFLDTQCEIVDTQSDAILVRFGEPAARGAIYGWEVNSGDELVRVVTKINTDPRYVIVSASYAPFTEIAHEIELYGGPDSSGKRAGRGARGVITTCPQRRNCGPLHERSMGVKRGRLGGTAATGTGNQTFAR